MKKCVLIAIAAVLLAGLVCSAAWSESGDVYLAGYLLLRVRCGAGPYTLEQRADKLQHRANDLLELGKNISVFTVKKAGKDAAIYADKELFMTVTQADAKANGTTVEKQAAIWAERLKTIYPDAKPEKPGVGGPSPG